MFGYYLDLARRSLKRSPGLTALMVLSIGVGVALAMSTWTLVHLMSHDPIPQKSAVLYFPTIDAWGPASHSKAKNGDEPPNWLDYATATALLRDHRAKYQSAIYAVIPTVTPRRPGEYPFNVHGYAVTDEFFPMVDVPFKYGGSWSAADEADAAQVAVITAQLSEKLFGAGDSVGKTVVVGGRDYRVVGVMDDWNPQPVFFAISGTQGLNGFATHPTELYLPLSTAVAAKIEPTGEGCFKKPQGSGFADLMHSSCVWLDYMVQLDTPATAQRYKHYLEGFARQRFDWPPNIRLRDLMGWLAYEQVVPGGFKILRLVGVGLLIVCLVDTIGLMLAKFLRRSGEIGVRRALGAPRRAIYAQFLTETAVIGVAGGVLGIVFTWLAMAWMRAKNPDQWAPLTQLNTGLLALTLAVAIIATLLAALYPVWRAAHVQPAWQIKSN
ncbi:MAG TPA: ABC transporter permease [Rhodanobacteraceae bacterium]|nr:ABC transporter permease [Rhodanobacteraceae bacterium]